MKKKDTKTRLLEDMKPGQKTVTLALETPEECSTYSSLANRFNNIKGRRMGKYIHVSIDYPNCLVHLVCCTYEEYLKEKARELPLQWWKKRIKKKKVQPFYH